MGPRRKRKQIEGNTEASTTNKVEKKSKETVQKSSTTSKPKTNKRKIIETNDETETKLGTKKRGKQNKSGNCNQRKNSTSETNSEGLHNKTNLVKGKKKLILENAKDIPIVEVKTSDISSRRKFNSKIPPGVINDLGDNVSTESDFLPKKTRKSMQKTDDLSSSSESEWEEVEENTEPNIDDYKPNIPEEGVEITLEGPNLQKTRRKPKDFDMDGYIRCQINRLKKDVQLAVHQVHLLCLIACGFYLNKVLNTPVVTAFALSYLPDELLKITRSKVAKIDFDVICKIAEWFCKNFVVNEDSSSDTDITEQIIKNFTYRKASNAFEYNMMFVSIARTLNLKVRLCTSLYPITFKATDLLKKPKIKSEDASVSGVQDKQGTSDLNCVKKELEEPKKKSVRKKITKQKKPCKQNVNTVNNSSTKEKDVKVSVVKRPRRVRKKKDYKISSDDDNDDDDDDDKEFTVKKEEETDDSDFEKTSLASEKKKKRFSELSPKTVGVKKKEQRKNRKILSTDSETSVPEEIKEENGIDCWVEIYSKSEAKWISFECCNKFFNKPYEIEAAATQPITYVLAFDNQSYVKDVTRRYSAQWMTSTRKLRVDPDWWEETLEPYMSPNTKLDKDEEKQLEMMLINQPMPGTVSKFKNHPLYALKRHLLKFESIYPPDAPSIGFIRGEPVYARECIHTLHSREAWLKEARVVRIGEEPYKIVKARPKWDKIACVLRTDLPLHLFGRWQTEDYMPPVAHDGKVPRNDYGNVELFKPCMLPVGTVHLQIPCLHRVAKKLGIDCSPAVVGFDGHKGSVHPVFDGFIVCEEFKETLLAACEEEQENIRKREAEKKEKRVYGNWRKLIKHLLIREKIRVKYAEK